MKLYLNSLNQAVFSSAERVSEVIAQDLSSVSGASVSVKLHSVDEGVRLTGRPEGFVLIDDEPLEGVEYEYQPDVLAVASQEPVTERLCSHLLKSNCPVTGQPDWATLLVEYTGPAIERASLLRYVVGFRQTQDFHEHCVETIFTDLMARCRPEHLTVCARYTRRGGLDINPLRSTMPDAPFGPRLIRQ
jgi:7-cyano-7-deazaguanine reductase